MGGERRWRPQKWPRNDIMKRAANLIRATCTSPARPAVAPMTKQTMTRTTATVTATRVQQQQQQEQEVEELEEAAGWTKIMTSIGQVSHFVYEANKMASQPSGTRQADGGGGREKEKEWKREVGSSNWIPLSGASFSWLC